jgi:23S rRNA (guanosine2251-2'-O)-methyltransferase
MDIQSVVWGRRAVEELLNSGRPVRKVLLADASRPSLRSRIQDLCRSGGVECRIAPLSRLAELSRTPEHGGVVAVVSPLPLLNLEQFLSVPEPERQILFAFDGVENPRNLGMAARSLAGAGVPHLMVPAVGGAQPDATFLEASAGVGERIGIVRVPKLADALRELKTQGYWIFGLAGESSQSLWQHALPLPAVFVLGGEAKGLHPSVRKILHESLSIPMAREVESLNVAVAASLVAFELARRALP